VLVYRIKDNNELTILSSSNEKGEDNKYISVNGIPTIMDILFKKYLP